MEILFGSDEARSAYDEWGCNCGPTALAAALGKTLAEIRPCMGSFEQRGYTNVTNMRESIMSAGGRITRTYEGWPPTGIGLCRIQWGGPWIIDGKPARWAARASHWVATWRNLASYLYVFDVNGGIRLVDDWEQTIVPLIVASIKRADGTYKVSHSFGIARS